MAAYHRPATLEDALAIRAEGAVTVLAGGTDVYPARAARVGWGDMRRVQIGTSGEHRPRPARQQSRGLGDRLRTLETMEHVRSLGVALGRPL